MFYKSVIIFAVVAVLVLVPNLLLAKDRVIEGLTGSKGRPDSHIMKVYWQDGSNAVIEFTDQIMDSKVALSIFEQFSVIVRKLGKKHTKIVLDVPKASLEFFDLNVFSIILKVLAEENGNRERDGLKPVQVLIWVTSSPFMANIIFKASKYWFLVLFITVTIMLLRGNLD